MKTSSDYLFLAFLILCALGIIDALACAPMPGPIASAPSAGLDPAPTDCADLPLEVALCDATNTPPWIDQPIPVRLDLDISWRPALQRAIAYWERASAFRFTIVADPSVPAVVIRPAGRFVSAAKHQDDSNATKAGAGAGADADAEAPGDRSRPVRSRIGTRDRAADDDDVVRFSDGGLSHDENH